MAGSASWQQAERGETAPLPCGPTSSAWPQTPRHAEEASRDTQDFVEGAWGNCLAGWVPTDGRSGEASGERWPGGLPRLEPRPRLGRSPCGHMASVQQLSSEHGISALAWLHFREGLGGHPQAHPAGLPPLTAGALLSRLQAGFHRGWQHFILKLGRSGAGLRTCVCSGAGEQLMSQVESRQVPLAGPLPGKKCRPASTQASAPPSPTL